MNEFLSEYGIRYRKSEQRLGPGDLVRLLLGRQPVTLDIEGQYVVEIRLGWRARPRPRIDLNQFFTGKSAFELTDRDTYLHSVSDLAGDLGISPGHVRATAMWLRLPLASPHPQIKEGRYQDGAVLRNDVTKISASIEREKKR